MKDFNLNHAAANIVCNCITTMKYWTLFAFLLTANELFGQVSLRQMEKEIIDEDLYQVPSGLPT
jgi:hypothetical protein